MTKPSAGPSSPPADVVTVRDERATEPLEAAAAEGTRASWFAGLVADLAPHDWLIVLLIGLTLTRGAILRRDSFGNAFLYRLTLFTTVLSSYFELRIILPASAPRAVDATLFAIDQAVFHYEPALAWDRFVNPQTTEWFAFFYFGYFFLLAIHVLPFMLAGRNMAILARFATAIFFTFCCGHLLYIVVPGFGPYKFLASSFTHELKGGLFWGMVKATVADAGAQKDIFPSLHTAVPSMFTLLAWKHRREFAPFRVSWWAVGFCTSQIIIATMFLRWHYLIDICAGLTLAALAVQLADRAVTWDDARRARLGLAPAWRPLVFGRHS